MTGGTGLGLYSLAKRIEALEGMYGIDDRRDGGKGCGIWFAFPYRPDYTMAPQASFYGIGGASMDYPSAVRSGSFLNIDDSTEQRSALSSHQSSRVSLFLPLTGESDDSNSSSGLSRVPTAPRILEAVRSGMIRNSSVQDPHVRRQDLPPVMEGRKESREGSIADADDASDSVPTPACSLPAKDKDHRDDTAHNYASTASLGGSELLHSPGERQGLRILLVDDALSILKVAGKSLTLKGHSVETAQNGSIALERLKKSLIASADKAGHRDFDFVLIDLQMPVMDGFEAVRRYREFEKKFYEEHPDLDTDAGKYARHQLIIGASANSDSVSRQGALDAGMDFFIPKPYTYNDLLPILRAEGFIDC
jgi:CheY-like chemotaxis protein